MIILLTNDDGIKAGGLARLINAAKEFGEVWVVAPDGERSASSHCISLEEEMDIYPYDYGDNAVRAFTCSGTPADCVRVGSLSVMPYPPDVVISGINDGYNSATDIQYSGTCGAAFEASFQGYNAIALSEGRGGVHEVTDKYLKEVLSEVISKKNEFGWMWNINFPNIPLADFQGILRDRSVSQGLFFKDSYKVVKELPNGGKRYKIDGRIIKECESGSDLRAILDGYISISYVNNMGILK